MTLFSCFSWFSYSELRKILKLFSMFYINQISRLFSRCNGYLYWVTDLLFSNSPLALFRMGSKKGPPTSFSIVTFTKYELAPKTFWFLVLTLLPHCHKIPRLYFVSVPNYWTWTKTIPQKKVFFWSNPYKIEVMISSLIEMLELPNFGHMPTSTV